MHHFSLVRLHKTPSIKKLWKKHSMSVIESPAICKTMANQGYNPLIAFQMALAGNAAVFRDE
jgi:hypothetical protein